MLIVADGNNLAWAGFHALRRSMNPATPAERTRCALLGLTQSVLGLAVRAGEPPGPGVPAHIAARNAGRVSGLAVAFDEGRPLMRRSIWPAYQTSRESDPNFRDNEPDIVEAIRQFREAARWMPVLVAQGTNTEADDLAAFLVLHEPGPVRIASTDRDFLQLLDERVTIYSPVKRVVVTCETFEEQCAPRSANGIPVPFPRERYLDYRAASGDTSDDLPGIPRLGTLGAARMLAFAPLDAYLEDPGLAVKALGRQNPRLGSALRSGEAVEIVARNRVLMDLRAAARRYDSLDGMLQTGAWSEAEFRAWFRAQRVAGLDEQAAVIALDGIARTSGG
jgi:5'-3' exonuclease